jgi:hypothetical protein
VQRDMLWSRIRVCAGNFICGQSSMKEYEEGHGITTSYGVPMYWASSRA